MNASRRRIGSFISGRRVETVTIAEVFDGAEGALARSEPEVVAIGAMVVSGVSSIGFASDWLTFWLTPASFAGAEDEDGPSGPEGGLPPLDQPSGDKKGWTAPCVPLPLSSGVARDDQDVVLADGDPRRSRRGLRTSGPGGPRRFGSPGLGPFEGEGPGGRPGKPFDDSLLNSAVSAQIATKLNGTIARRINWSQFIGAALAGRGLCRTGQELTGSRRALLVPVPAIELRISVSAWTLRRL